MKRDAKKPYNQYDNDLLSYFSKTYELNTSELIKEGLPICEDIMEYKKALHIKIWNLWALNFKQQRFGLFRNVGTGRHIVEIIGEIGRRKYQEILS